MNDTYFVNAGFPGVGAIGRHGDREGFWNYVDLAEEESIDTEGDVYIFGAFHKAYGDVVRLIGEDAWLGFLFTSSTGEIDLEPVEQKYLNFVVNWERTDFVWFGDPSLGTIFGNGFYAPYPISLQLLKENCEGVEARDLEGDPAITLLNPSTAKKNALNQVVAVKMLQEETGYEPVLHTVMEDYEQPLNLIDVDYVLHDWLEGDDYWSVLKGSDLNMCVSWAETFSYQTLEAIYAGTLPLVSETVDWVPLQNRVQEVNNPAMIAEAARRTLDREETVSRDVLETVAETRNQELNHALQKNGVTNLEQGSG